MPLSLRTSTRSLALALALAALATACGGREDASQSAAPDGGGSPAADAAAPGDATSQAAGPLALSPEDAEKLAAVRDAYAAKNPKRAPVTEIVSSDGSPIAFPESYPKDLPIEPNGRPVRYASSADAGTLSVIESDQGTDALRTYYIGALGDQGWTIEGDSTKEGLTMVRAAKDDRVITLVIFEEEGTSKAVFTWSGE